MIGGAVILLEFCKWLKKKLELSCISNINTCLRKHVQNRKLQACQVLDDNFVDSALQHNDGFKVLKKVRSSPAFDQQKRKELMAMFRQTGKQHFFFLCLPWNTAVPNFYNI